MRNCTWCDEARHRSDFVVVDDKLICNPDLTDCKKEYLDDTRPGINTDRAQLLAFGKRASQK